MKLGRCARCRGFRRLYGFTVEETGRLLALLCGTCASQVRVMVANADAGGPFDDDLLRLVHYGAPRRPGRCPRCRRLRWLIPAYVHGTAKVLARICLPCADEAGRLRIGGAHWEWDS